MNYDIRESEEIKFTDILLNLTGKYYNKYVVGTLLVSIDFHFCVLVIELNVGNT